MRKISVLAAAFLVAASSAFAAPKSKYLDIQKLIVQANPNLAAAPMTDAKNPIKADDLTFASPENVAYGMLGSWLLVQLLAIQHT